MTDFIDTAFMTGVVIALAQLLKQVGVSSKLIPLANIVLGIISGIVYISPTDAKLGVLYGIIVGLNASGLYSGVKNAKEVIMKEK